MTSAARALFAGISVVLVTVGSGAQTPSTVTLAVPDATNTTPSLAIAERTVAAVWTATRDGRSNLYLAISRNGGASFDSPVRVNDVDGEAGATNEQPPRVVLSGPAGRTVTVVWAKRDTGPQHTRRDVIRLSQSFDGGRTFAPARLTHDAAFTGARGWQSLAIAPDRSLHVVWLDGREAERKIAAASHAGTPHKGQPPQELYHATLEAKGHAVETRIASDVCFCCKTALVIDARGGIYTAWRHIFPGSMRDIAFAKSTDGGRTFSPPVRVSHDNWQLNGCPEDGPTLAIDKSGVIHIAWATLVNDGEPIKALFYSKSVDGVVFAPRARIPIAGDTAPGHPQLVLMPDGGASIVFDEVVAGLRRVSFARVTRSGVITSPQILSGADAASNPVLVAAPGGGVLVAWANRSAATSSIQLRHVR